jgi:putative phosphoribosyl transferase
MRMDPRIQPRFHDRTDAGRALAADLAGYGGRNDVVVLALPRGGVPVAYEVARALGAPLDVFLVRKLGLPGHEELAMGAIASGGIRLINEQVVQAYQVTRSEIEKVAAVEQAELERRELLYRDGRPLPRLVDRTVILVDDGLATGATMRVAVLAVRAESPARIVVAVPVASADTCDEFRGLVDDVVCAETPEPFYAVGVWYENFEQTTDREVHDLLQSTTPLS